MGVESNDGYKRRILFVGEASNLKTGFSNIYRELLARLSATNKYEIAEFGSYASQNDPKVQEVIKGRWKFYGNNPETEEEQQLFNQADPAQPGQNTNQFGKWKFEAVLSDFRPDIVIDIRDWWMCLAKNTPIFTKDGVKGVQEITTDDEVLADDGVFRKVINTFERNYRGVTHKITPKYAKIPVTITDKHPVLAVVREKKHWKNGGGWPDFNNVQPQWISPEKLSSGDFVCYPIPKTSKEFEKSDQFARLLGYYAAEGCIMYEGRKEDNKLKGVQFTFGTNELEQSYVDDVVNLIKEEFNVVATTKVVNDSYTVVRAFDKNIAETINKFVPGTAINKKVHSDILESENSTIAQFLTGLFRGDGGIDDNRGFFNTASESLAHTVFFMCAKLGFTPSFSKNKNKLNGNIHYRYVFNFAGRNGIVHNKFKNLYNGIFDVNEARDCTHSNDNYIFLPISKIERDEGELLVYNFEVDEKQSYTSSFAMHNCAYQERSPFRQYFKWLLMPTVDSIPQKEEWIRTYEGANYIMAYSDFGIDSLRKSSPKLELRSDPPGKPGFMIELEKAPGKLHPKPLRPGVDMKTFRPRSTEEKSELKKKWGIKPDVPIILLVQRNQARKRISEVMTAFARMKRLFPDNHFVQKSILLMHTAWPDNHMSVDFPRAIARLQRGYHGVPEPGRKGIIKEICSTYICRNPQCNDIFVAPSINLLHGHRIQNGIFTTCPSCGNVSANTPNTGAGLSREQLSEVYSMSDMMVQMSIAEGCGMPVQEAKACGLPVLVTDYAAIAEKGRVPDYEHVDPKNYSVHLGGETMDVAYLYEEPETTCWRAMTSIDDCADKMGKMIGDPSRREKMSLDARRCVEENYDWDKNWKEWEFILDRIKLLDRSETWDKPAKFIDIDTSVPDPSLSDEEFVVWCYTRLLGYENEYMIDEEGKRNWLEKLKVESASVPRERSRQEIVNFFRSEAEKINQVERMRVGTSAPSANKTASSTPVEKDDDFIEGVVV